MRTSKPHARLLLAFGAVTCLSLVPAFADETNSPPAPPPPPEAAAPAKPTPPPQPEAVAPAKPAPAPAPQPEAAPAATPTPAAPVAANKPAKLPYGVDDIVKLQRAQISEDVIVNYVLNSGTVYNLAANDVVTLRNEGLSDRVITTMMNQRQRVPDEALQQAGQQAALQQAVTQPMPPPGYVDNGGAAAYPPNYGPNYVVVPSVEEPPASSVYVIPYGPVRSAYYGYGPYSYYNNYGNYVPGVSVVYHVGSHGYYRGGYHRGWYRR